MSTVGANSATLKDIASRLDEDNKVAKVIEILAQNNEILDDMKFMEGNLATGHKTTIRTGIPAGTWRKLNYGVTQEKSTTAQVTDTCGMLESYSKVDKALVELNGNESEFRASEDVAFIEGLSQTFADIVFHGDTSLNPERFMGLEPRYSDTTAENGENIILGGGSGADNASIYLVVWGDQSVHGIYPRGSVAGLKHTDLGESTLTDAAGGEYQGLRTHYKWDGGLTVKNWKYVVRIPNIDISDLTKDAATGADLVDLITQALELPPNLNGAAIYCNKTIRSMLRRQIKNSNNVHLSLDEVAGKKVLSFDGVPVRRCDVLTNAESLVA
tara:strand:+ start:20884 stop:21867 length:984 start_codon:yes stop_codon:yes gene_type:complete